VAGESDLIKNVAPCGLKRLVIGLCGHGTMWAWQESIAAIVRQYKKDVRHKVRCTENI
jgi:hypothetical protein